MVLVEADDRPRLQWPLGIVTQAFPGRDGLVRSVEVKIGSGKLTRSVQRIHDLEIMTSGLDDASTTVGASTVNSSDNSPDSTAEIPEKRDEIKPENTVYKTRSGRVVKPIVRLDI